VKKQELVKADKQYRVH